MMILGGGGGYSLEIPSYIGTKKYRRPCPTMRSIVWAIDEAYYVSYRTPEARPAQLGPRPAQATAAGISFVP